MGRPLFFGNLGTPDHTQINMLAIKVWSCVPKSPRKKPPELRRLGCRRASFEGCVTDSLKAISKVFFI